MNNKITFSKIFSTSLTKYSDIFDLFDASLSKVILYFLLLNFMIVLPITLQVVNLEEPNYSRWGLTFHETVPEWIPDELPTHCVIRDQQLQCASSMVYEYEVINRDTVFTVYLNASDETTVSKVNSIVLKESTFDVYINEHTFTFYYRGFDYIDFADLHEEDARVAYDLLIESFFQSIKPTLILPVIIFFLGVLTIANLFLIVVLAAFSMLFSINNSNFPKFKNMIKLMIFASTVPSFINLILGFLEMSAFTSITYNLITPLIAYLMFRQSSIKQEIKR